MRYHEQTVWVMADGRLWEGVGYFPVHNSLNDYLATMIKVGESMQGFGLAHLSVDWESLELFASDLEITDEAHVARIEKWLAGRGKHRGDWMVWRHVVNSAKNGGGMNHG